MCGQGHDPFSTRRWPKLTRFIKGEQKQWYSFFLYLFIYFFWFKWGGGRGIWQVKILLGVYNLNVTGPGGECGQY